MLYSITFYLINQISQLQFTVNEYINYEIYSHVPIVQCTGYVEKQEASNMEDIVHYCTTEKLYSLMTGQESVVIRTTGRYKI